MKGSVVLSAAAGAVGVLGLVTVAYHLGRGRLALDPESERVATGERDSALAELQGRLAHIEAEIAALRAEPPEREATDGEEPEAEAVDRLTALESVLADLQLRVRGLEEDPVHRGFTFLESQNAELRREGVNLLDRVARFDPEARAALRSLLSDPSARVREQAAQKLRDLKDKESEPAMIALLADPDPRTRRRAVQALGAIESKRAARDIGRNLVSDESASVREEAAQVLGELGSPEATEFLAAALKDSSEAVRAEAIVALGKVGATSAAPQLRALYEQDPGNQRLRLVQVLKTLGDEVPLQREVTRLSEVAKTDADEGARVQAIRELSALARDASQAVFSEALEDPSPRVRREAERALR